jgi:hypothetical protein
MREGLFVLFGSKSPGLVISRNQGRVMPPPSLFPSASLGVKGSAIPQHNEILKVSRQSPQKDQMPFDLDSP